MDIPKHIKYLSILFFLNAAIALLVGGLSLTSMLKRLTQGENPSDLRVIFSTLITDFGVSILATILVIVFLIFLSLSLRKLKPWARSVTLVYSSLTILLSLISLLSGDGNFSYHFFVQIYAVWVLTRPEIKEAFL